MASVDGARSQEITSEETFQFECSPCEYDGLKRQAIFFCAECGDYLCESCEQSHKKFSRTRKHELVSGSMMPKRGESLEQETLCAVVLCSCNKKEVTMYCKDHDTVVCRDCQTLEHRNCQMSKNSEESSSFDYKIADQTLKNLNDILEKLTQLQHSRTKDLQNLTILADKCRENIKSFKAEIIAQLDIMEEQTFIELNKYDLQQRKLIEDHINACNTALAKSQSDKKSFEIAKSAGDRNQLFIRNVQLSKLIDNLSKLTGDIESEVHEPKLSFASDDRLKRTDTSRLGIVKGGGSKAVTERIRHVAEMKVRSSRQVDVKLPNDSNMPFISGSVFLPSGELVLCDWANSKLKVLKENFTHKENIVVPGTPWDVSVVSDTEVVITLSDKQMLQFSQTIPKLSLGNTVHLHKQCHGIAVHDGLLYVSFYEGDVLVMDRNGQKKKTVVFNQDTSFRFKTPLHIAVSKSGRICVSENTSTPTICCMLFDGKSVYSYQDSALVFGGGMFVDDGENVLVCGYSSNNVHVIDKDGKRIKILLSAEDGSQYPRSITVRQTDNTLVVGGHTNNILICKME